MQEFQIGNTKKLCFVVKKGEVKNIVVPYDSLADIDLKRFFDMEKQGGELMRVMRDTTLDNGVNALVMYADMLIDVDVPVKAKPAETKQPAKEVKGEEEDEDEVINTSLNEVDPPEKKERKSKPRTKK